MNAASRDREVSVRVLVVDDNVDQVQTMALLLRNLGYVVDSAGTARLAIKRVKEGRPDIVFLDIHLPDGTGFDVARAIRAMKGLQGVRIIGLTAADVKREEALAAGFDTLYEKPMDFERIRVVLGKMH